MERRDWLDRVERGDRVDVIARESNRDTRTINTNVERARRERDFAAAQRDRLRDALNAHQQDLLELLRRVGQSAVVPGLDWVATGTDFGLEDLMDDEATSRNSEVLVAPPQYSSVDHHKNPLRVPGNLGVTVARDRSGPKEVRFAEEGSKQWLMLLEHINQREALWTGVSSYKTALLEECKARAALNRHIKEKVEAATSLYMLSVNQLRAPCVMASLASMVKGLVTHRALSSPESNTLMQIHVSGPGMLATLGNRVVAEFVKEPEQVKEHLLAVVEEVTNSPETRRAADTYRSVQHNAGELRDTVEDYLILRYISGSCRICKLLGAP